jgi:hypothetical protein
MTKNCQLSPSRLGLLAAIAVIALLPAACSGASANPLDAGTTPRSITSNSSSAAGTSSASSGSGTPTAAAGSAIYQKAIGYAHCMRQHGIPNFPDPLPNGGFLLGPSVTGGAHGQVSPQYQAAENACAALSPTGTLSPQQQQQALRKLLKVSACMRSHGFKNFPDPTFNSQGIELNIIGFDRNSPQFQSAFRTCTAQAGANGNAG